MLDELRLLP